MKTDRLRVLDDLESPDLWSEIERRPPRGETFADLPRRRQGVTLAVAAAVGLASILVAISLLSPTGRSVGSLDTNTWAEFGTEALDISVRYPSQWFVQPFNESIMSTDLAGVLISNVRHAFRHPDLGPDAATSEWDLRGLPDDAVVIDIWHVEVLGIRDADPDSPLPLDLDNGNQTRGGGRYISTSWKKWQLEFHLAGRLDSLRVMFGPDASERDREIARLIVESITPLVHSLDGWNVAIGWGYSESGPLEITAEAPLPARETEAHPWIQHSVFLKNTGSETLLFDDTDVSAFLGLPDPELLAADEGCGWGQSSPTAPVEAGACRLSLDTFEIPPGGTVRREVTLYKDLPGMAPLTEGRYVFEKIYRFAVDGSDQKSTVHVRLIYDVRAAT